VKGDGYTPEDIAKMRAIAEQLDYSWKAMVTKYPQYGSRIRHMSRYGLLTPEGTTLRKAFIKKRAERVIAALKDHGNDWAATAAALFVNASTLRYYIQAAGLYARDIDPMLAPRPCIECGKPVYSSNSTRKTCGMECAMKRTRRRQNINWRMRNGLDPHAPSRFEAAEQKYKTALIEYFGRPTLINRMLGINISTLDAWIQKNDMRGFQYKCQERERDPDFLKQLLEDNDWDFGRAGRAIWRSARFVRDCLRAAGRHDIVDNAPCKVCGKSVPRMGKRRPMCSVSCKRIQHSRNARMRYQSKERTCINRSQSQEG